MESGITIECCEECPIKDIGGYCNTCKSLFCKKCVLDHVGHATMKLEEFCEKKKKNVLDQISISEISTQLEKKWKKVVTKGKKLNVDGKNTKILLNIKEKAAENKDENYELEIGRMEDATRCLLGLEEEASTVALRNACEEALKLFDLEETIKKEFKTLDDSIADAKRRMKEMKKEMKKLQKEKKVLNYFRGGGKYEFDDEKWATFLLLNEKTPLFKPIKQKTDITKPPTQTPEDEKKQMEEEIQGLKQMLEQAKMKAQENVQALEQKLEQERKKMYEQMQALKQELRQEKARTQALIQKLRQEKVRAQELEQKLREELREEGTKAQENIQALKQELREEKTLVQELREELSQEKKKAQENMQAMEQKLRQNKMKPQKLNQKISDPSRYCINTTVGKFRAFPFIEKVLDIKKVMPKKLIDVGQGVKMTEPINVEKGLLTGDYIHASLSHQGILAICASKTIQFIDLNTNRQVEMEVETDSLAGFYNNMVLLLTYDKPLREATVEKVFNNPRIETFKEIKGTNDVYSYTDVSLLHVRRVLYYPTMNGKMFSFNVDTRENIEINVGRNVWSMASLTGINCGIRAVFKSDDKCTYTLNNDNTVTKVNERQEGWLTTLFPSASNPKNITDAVFKYDGLFRAHLMKDGNKIDTRKFIEFEYNHSVIRVYRDIFLAFDKNTKSWVLLRIFVP